MNRRAQIKPWYVVQSSVSSERKASDELKRAGYDVFWPVWRKEVKHNRRGGHKDPGRRSCNAVAERWPGTCLAHGLPGARRGIRSPSRHRSAVGSLVRRSH
ncbi:transcription termination/antitermination NusG family protein [Mesorhizobium sp.]|uniref:transcription termination/antitermination NusG family protein n=1 Tax=Mesorhizobium sp. TaxID=1871066 RepID=UPI000FD32AC7|nr:hypothetical protein EOA86_19855 [Mesorhizobium sp. M5C.F.Ca.IN.020.32.2.1]RWG45986.1 MAG: hypothetical protein EOQ62_16035 [Mesorhizobium sp.]RWH49781.1 MAG: hypothetical protein EOQ80_05990 [Mesorhizobium sp.]RWH55454.1 MAG: hypothetical protein EOQ82_16375 [Mesorhizobium sp.]RWI66156.1 MAG: hypothetical protein EOR19_32210 [Mesorhizobium sp.]